VYFEYICWKFAGRLPDRVNTPSVASVGSRQRRRSATRGDLVISPTVTYFGARSFAVAGHKA